MDMSPSALFFGVVFGPLGFAALQIGRKRDNYRMAGIGLLLMGLTFIASGSVWYWLSALALCGLIFWP